jgi:sRNA-binding regulator protein Hfq
MPSNTRDARARGAARRENLEAGDMNRKLIRPDLTDMKDHRHTPVTTPKYFRQRRATPPDQTNAEGNYYLKQMANKTRMVIVLKDGEELRGTIEWYDKWALKVHRPDAPNILLMKDNVKYMFKENEDKDGEVEE